VSCQQIELYSAGRNFKFAKFLQAARYGVHKQQVDKVSLCRTDILHCHLCQPK
jgi:hypothetical protein